MNATNAGKVKPLNTGHLSIREQTGVAFRAAKPAPRVVLDFPTNQQPVAAQADQYWDACSPGQMKG